MVFRPQVLRLPIRILLDDFVRRLEDPLRRAVILLEEDDFGPRVILLEG